MILNMYTYRTIKNALALIPGAPGSSKLGELMAAAWEFPSYHALKAALEEVETRIAEIPDRAEIFADLLIERCEDMAIDREVARSLGATMLLVQDAEFAVEMMGEYDDLHGARAYRFDQTTEQWREAVTMAMRILSETAPGRAWILPLSNEIDWRHPDPDSQDIAHRMAVIDHDPLEEPDIRLVRPYRTEEFEMTDRAVDRGGYLPVTIAENVLGMCQQVMPEGAQWLLLGPRGVTVRYGHFDICLVDYDHRDLQLHAPIMTLEGPEMI